MKGSTKSLAQLASMGLKACRSLGRAGSGLTVGRSRARPVAQAGELPLQVDVVVIGGGFVGVCTALTLAERGVTVLLCEKGVIAGEASGRAFGLSSNAFLSAVKMPLIARSQELWKGMQARVEADVGYSDTGFCCVFESEAQVGFAAAWLEQARRWPGINSRVLGAEEAQSRLPETGRKWAGGLLQMNDSAVEPRLAAPAIAEAARRRGAVVLQNTAVRAIERSAGLISGVVTERGAVKTPVVVVAAGVWSPLVARTVGLELPQLQAWASMASIKPVRGASSVAASAGGINFRRESDGGYSVGSLNSLAPVTPAALANLSRILPTLVAMQHELDVALNVKTFMHEWRIQRSWRPDEISPFEKHRILQPEVRPTQVDTALATLRSFPGFSGAEERERWAGAVATTLDNMPVLSAVRAIPGLIFGSGMYYGLTMGPAAGEALADIAMGKTTRMDLHPYRYERFGDGSELTYVP